MPTVEENNAANVAESSVGLQDYTRLKLELADIIRSAKQAAEEHKDEIKATDCRKLLARLAEDRFNLAVVGQFSRGKSSLMNAILGVERLPTSVLPLTSVITTVSYGDRERVLIHWKWTSYPSAVPIGDLTKYVTQESNPGNEKRVAVAEVQLPVELLRLGFHFIDTPGIGSAITANTATTTEFLPEADAVIFVTSFESPLSEAELKFLSQIRQHVRKIFVVINKSDLVSPEQQASVSAFSRERLRELLGGDIPKVFIVSARDGLNAKQNGDADKQALAGLPQLETALVGFLKKDKAREFLQRVADRTADVLGRQALEIRIAQALGNQKEKGEELEKELVKQSDQLQDEFEEIVKTWRTKVGLELPRHFESDLAGLMSELKDHLPSRIEHGLASVNAWDSSPEPDVVKLVQDFAQKRLTTWLTEREQLIEQFLRDEVCGDVRLFGERASSMTRISVAAISADLPASNGELRLEELLDNVPLTVRGVQADARLLEAPWWFGFVPVSPLRTFVLRRTVNKLDEFLATCLNEVQVVLEIAGMDWIDRLRTNIEDRIAVIVARQRDTIRNRVAPQKAAAVDHLRANLATLVAELSGVKSGDKNVQPEVPVQESRVPRSDLRARCVLCVQVEAALFDFMRRRQYELHTRGIRQQTHAERGGFCALHTWQYEAIASPQGVCSAYPPVLSVLSQRLRAIAKFASSPHALADALLHAVPQPGTCEACELMMGVESAAAKRVVAQLSDDQTSPPPLCVRHLSSVLVANPPMDVALLLVDEQARVLERVGEEMQRYSLKHEALKRHLATEQEQRAYEIGLSRLAGLRTIVEPWKVDEI